MKNVQLFLVAAAVALLVACATTTKISSAWNNPGYTGGAFSDLLVVGVGKDQYARRLYEDQLVEALAAYGARATSSHTILPDAEQLNKADIKRAVEQHRYDAVVVTRLLAVDRETTAVPARKYVVPAQYVNHGYYGYYRQAYQIVTEPGYTRTDTSVRLETNVYASQTEQLARSGRSETFDPESLSDTINSATQAITKRLAKDNVIGQ
ncbi:MAG: hypothetical protein ACR2RB_12405 [Gammaproteobacteria bacterium]